MATERNALAELAETLRHHIEPRRLNADKDEFAVAICCSQRIVAELGKPDRIDGRIACEIMMKCRAIAEEAKDEAK